MTTTSETLPLMLRRVLALAALPLLFIAGGAVAQAADGSPARFKFSFGSQDAPGYTRVDAAAKYSDEKGYGFDVGGGMPSAVAFSADDALHSGCVTASQPFFFSAKVPEGNYRVTVTLGDAKSESTTTVKAELRRLMLEQVHIDAGQFVTRSFVVNVRRPQIAGGGEVRLKGREPNRNPGGEYWAWDDKLSIEFSDKHPAVCALDIERIDDAITVYLCGDSTVCDQPADPFNSWGQMITRWFDGRVAVCNHAISGETTTAFYGEKRMDKIVSGLKKGDYVFVQFGHNDMKPNSVPLNRYKELYQRFVADTRSKGATPVIMTPVSRETFDNSGKITNSFGEFPDAVRQVAKEEDVAFIDLQEISVKLYEALGRNGAQVAFANASEKTHHSDYGSYLVAKCVVQAIIDTKLPLAERVLPEWKQFDAAHPEPFAAFKLPRDPMPGRAMTPAGN